MSYTHKPRFRKVKGFEGYLVRFTFFRTAKGKRYGRCEVVGGAPFQASRAMLENHILYRMNKKGSKVFSHRKEAVLWERLPFVNSWFNPVTGVTLSFDEYREGAYSKAQKANVLVMEFEAKEVEE